MQVYIKKAQTHADRMAVRAKNMSSEPDKNKYVKYMGNIRAIQDYHVKTADKLRMPKVHNSNVDRSVTLIHSTVVATLRRYGTCVLSDIANTVVPYDH